MNIRDLVKKRLFITREGFAYIPKRVTSLTGLDMIPRNKLEIEANITDYSELSSPNLVERLTDLRITNHGEVKGKGFETFLKSLDPFKLKLESIAKLKKLRTLSLGFEECGLHYYVPNPTHRIWAADHSFLDSDNLRKTLEELEITASTIDSLQFLQGYSLRKIKLTGLPKLKNTEGLDSPSILESLEELTIKNTEIKQWDFLRRYQRLRKLVLPNYSTKPNLHALNSPNLQSTLTELYLCEEFKSWNNQNPTTLFELDFLKKYQQLQTLVFSGSNIIDFSGLSSPKLSKTIKKLVMFDLVDQPLQVSDETIRSFKEDTADDDRTFNPYRAWIELLSTRKEAIIFNLKLIQEYEALEELSLGNLWGVKDFSGLHNPNYANTLRKLTINSAPFLDNVDFLDGYTLLEEIWIKDLDNNFSDRITPPLNVRGLSKPKVATKLRRVHIDTDQGIADFDFLHNCEMLDELVIRARNRSQTPINFEGLCSASVAQTLTHLSLFDFDGLENLDFLNNYKKLERLDLYQITTIKDHSAIASEGLEHTVRDVRLHSSGFSDINLFKNYQKLKRLDIGLSSVRDISNLLEFESVKNGTLQSIELPKYIDLMRVKDGKYVTQEVLLNLKAKGIKVKIGGKLVFDDKHYKSKGKVYVICGPSGAGKTTIINYLEEELSVKKGRKTTTRGYRSEEERTSKVITSINDDEYTQLELEGKLKLQHDFCGKKYGIHTTDLLEAHTTDQKFVFDTCDIESALELKSDFPGLVELIILLTPPPLVERGLMNRLSKYPAKAQETLRRIGQIQESAEQLRAYKTRVNHFVAEPSYTANLKIIREIISGN
ncbi:ATP-binding cassette domain-containing protein [Candidatus Woesearchaeota archaeon]|jgi:guanylate kinase|nr:ATP-binding cassette domain-containing protein [Candidatus Woesearchaeota archaeon]